MINSLEMKKKEAIEFIKKQKGYIPYATLFELYNDDDTIPQQLIDLECRKDVPMGDFMIFGESLHEQLKKLK